MEINQKWNYKECLKFITSVKDDYVGFLHSFYNAESKSRNKKLFYGKAREIKKQIYSLEFEEWRKDKLWEYLNGDIPYEELYWFIYS